MNFQLSSAYLVAAAIVELTLVLTFCFVEKVRDARFVLTSEGGTASASNLGVRRTLVCVFADETIQNAVCNQFYEPRSTLQQRVVGSAA